MDPLTRLIESERIARLKYRYMRCVDQKRWSEVADCLCEDASASYGGGSYRFEGRDAIVDFLERAMGADSFHSSHRVSQPEIHFVDDARASGIWALHDEVIDTRWQLTIRGAGFYEDVYVRQGERWWISRTGYKRTFEEVVPRKSIEGLKLTASLWTTGGRSELPVPE